MEGTLVLLVEGEEEAVPNLELGKKKYFLFFFFFFSSFFPFMDRKKSIHPIGVCNAQFDVVEQRKGSVTAYTHTHTSQSIINKRMKTATHRIVQFPLCAFIL